MKEIIPIELSADGKRNAYSHSCEHVQASKNYAVCLHLIHKQKVGQLPSIYSDCGSAIDKKRCPAMKMRATEAEKGQAIYFTERVRSEAVYMDESTYQAPVVSNYKPKRTAKAAVVAPVVSVKPKTAEELFLDGGADISDAINESLKVEVKPEPLVKSVKKEVVNVANESGESLIEMARRMMNERKQLSEEVA